LARGREVMIPGGSAEISHAERTSVGP